MKKLALTFLIILFTLTSNVVWSADFNKGWEAFNSGDYATAFLEWVPLANQGNTTAQYNLGYMYSEGLGVPENDKTAVKWYTLAAEQGASEAQTTLGFMYANGEGVSVNPKTAAKWTRLAAEQGHDRAQSNLGWMYENGFGVLQDNIYAHIWANIAASNGNENGAKTRDRVSRRMSSTSISKAQNLARECVAKNYKGC